MLSKKEVVSLCRGEHGDPFSVLGLHTDSKGRLWLRSLQPGAIAVSAIDPNNGQVIIELTVVRHYALALVFITPLVLLIIGAATGEGANVPLALERVVDTLVGAAVGTFAALAVRLRVE